MPVSYLPGLSLSFFFFFFFFGKVTVTHSFKVEVFTNQFLSRGGSSIALP